jgi:hypothetical protein
MTRLEWRKLHVSAEAEGHLSCAFADRQSLLDWVVAGTRLATMSARCLLILASRPSSLCQHSLPVNR